MLKLVLKTAAGGAVAIAIAAGLHGTAHALPMLPVQNFSFSAFSGAAPKNNFSTVNPADWFQGAPNIANLVYVDAPGTATSFTGGYAVVGPFADPPTGGNYVQADGDPILGRTIEQTITGLTPGQQYTLSFWQAAGQQPGFSGDTTEQWKVFFGATGVVNMSCPGIGDCTYSSADTEYDSPEMDTPSQGVSLWQPVSLTVTATGTTDVLTFLAWGDGGSTANEPPTVFLAGVDPPALAPEPATLSLVGIGLVGLGAALWARRIRRSRRTKRPSM